MKEFIQNLEFDYQKIGGGLMGSGALCEKFGDSPNLFWAGFFSFVFGCFMLGIKKKNKSQG